MTESEWLSCTDPTPMLKFLQGRASERKLRLYLCVCCRRITRLFFVPESLTAVEVAERFADGNADHKELELAEWNAESPTFGYEFDERMPWSSPYRKKVVPRLIEIGALPKSALSEENWHVSEPIRVRLLAAAELAEFCAASSVTLSVWGLPYFSQVDWPTRWLMDCVFGNPFRPTTIDPTMLTPTVLSLAQAAYEHRQLPSGHLDPVRLTILSDAIEDTGCTDAELLGHLRSEGPHVRGCQILDLILGKE